MNQKLAEKADLWDEKRIVERSAQLADIICKRWPYELGELSAAAPKAM